MTKPQTPRIRPRTEFRVPPPLVQRIDSLGFTGTDLLIDEAFGPTAALVLWQCFRDVELWGTATARGELFHPESANVRESQIEEIDLSDGDLKAELMGFVELLRRPEATDPARIALLCSAVAAWLEGRSCLRSAVDFAVAAYLADPDKASLAVRVARLTRVLAEYPRSISWFDYSLYLARRSNDWQAYSEALAGLGNLYFQTGNFPRARYFHRRCLKVAGRKRLQEMVGAAYHNLFTVEMESGKVELAQSFAEKAFEAYSPTSPCLVRLARDLAHRWTVLGFFDRALPLALEMVNHFHRPVERAQVWAGVGRAAGGAGAGATFEDAWIETWGLVKRGAADPFAADVLIDLAHGAASLGDTRRAEHAAQKALAIAMERKEGHTILVAEALLDSLRPQPSKPSKPSQPSPQRHHTSEQRPERQRLDQGILRALQALRAAAA